MVMQRSKLSDGEKCDVATFMFWSGVVDPPSYSSCTVCCTEVRLATSDYVYTYV